MGPGKPHEFGKVLDSREAKKPNHHRIVKVYDVDQTMYAPRLVVADVSFRILRRLQASD
jgi:hypothetical protein